MWPNQPNDLIRQIRIYRYKALFLHKLRRSHSGDLLEQPAEVVGILEAQQVGHFSYSMTFHQKVLSLVYHEGVDIADGSAAGGLMDHVAEVASGLGQFAGTVCYGRETLLVLQSF